LIIKIENFFLNKRQEKYSEFPPQYANFDRRASGNSTYKKLAVQWLNEALCFISSSAVADSLVLRNRQLLVAAKR
jgi:hypothetical protein